MTEAQRNEVLAQFEAHVDSFSENDFEWNEEQWKLAEDVQAKLFEALGEFYG